MANFSECADTLICSTLSGSNGIGISLELGTPNKIVVSASNIPNSALANNSININGTTIVLGTTGSLAIGDITAVAAGTNLSGGGTSGSLTVSLTSSITGGLTNISGLTTLSSSQISGTFSGSGALINNLTASNISNFSNDVRNQFSAGSNIGISSGVILLSSSVSTTALSGTTGVSGALGLFTNLTGTNISGTTVQFATITGSNISGTSAQYTRITGSSISGSTLTYTTLSGTYISASQISGSYTGSGAGLFSLTASGISNFTNDVRAQFSAGTNITINNGVISASGGGGGGGTINTGSAGYVTYYPSAGTTVDDASGSTGGLYWDNTNIRLGINTNSPTYRLDVAGTGRFTSNFEVTGNVKSTGTIYGPGLILSNSSGFSSIEVGAPNGGYIDLKRPESDDYDLRMITDSTIEGGGYLATSTGAILSLSGSNVGVGTKTPSEKLVISSSGHSAVALLSDGNVSKIYADGNDSSTGQLSITADENSIGTNPLIITNVNGYNAAAFGNSSANNNILYTDSSRQHSGITYGSTIVDTYNKGGGHVQYNKLNATSGSETKILYTKVVTDTWYSIGSSIYAFDAHIVYAFNNATPANISAFPVFYINASASTSLTIGTFSAVTASADINIFQDGTTTTNNVASTTYPLVLNGAAITNNTKRIARIQGHFCVNSVTPELEINIGVKWNNTNANSSTYMIIYPGCWIRAHKVDSAYVIDLPWVNTPV